MKFIPLKSLLNLFGLKDNSEIPDIIALINQKKQNNLIFNGELITEENWNQIINALQNPKSSLFFSWVETNKNLEDFLSNGFANKCFSDAANHFSHAFGEEYKEFLTPFLFHQIKRNFNLEDIIKTKNSCSFLTIMNGDSRAILESIISNSIQNELNDKIELSKIEHQENKLVEFIQPICSDEIIEILNFLSKKFYASKIKYVDDLLSVIHFKACTSRFANWIINQLLKLKLNDEHYVKINSISRDLLKGKIQPKNQFESNVKYSFSMKKITLILGIIILGFLSIYLLVKNPFNSSEIKIETPETAYQQFTLEERKEIDSILKSIENKPKTEEIQQDAFFGQSAVLYSQHKFKNEKMSALYTDLILDANLVDHGQIVPLKAYSKQNQKSILYPGVSKINALKREQVIVFTNESEYDILLLCIDNNVRGKIYSKLIFPNERIKFEVFLYDEFIFIPGENFGPFIAPNVPVKDIPSKTFKHHFTQVDYNYVNGIKDVYRMKTLQDSPIKINAIGEKGEFVEIEDLNNGLLKL